MRPLINSFIVFIRQIRRDNMLLAVCLAPLLTALFFRFGIPVAEDLLTTSFSQQAIFSPYYLLFDLFTGLMASFMICFASAMVILTERDENMAAYLAVTPVGKRGYILSRLVFPAVLSVPLCVVLLGLFSLTSWSVPMIIVSGVLMAFSSVTAALLVIAFSGNKVEGLAMGKISGLLFIGLFAPFFVGTNSQYVVLFLPPFWISRLVITQNGTLFIPALLVVLIWIRVLSVTVERRLY